MHVIGTITSTLDAIEAANAELNCFLTVDRAGSLEAAHASQQRHDAGQTLGPFDGVPVAVKDNIDTAGLRTTRGSAIWEDRVPHTDAAVVEKLRAAGAVIVGKTNLTELACGTVGVNEHYGDCRNPHDVTRYPGGSSSGSAAAVGAGSVDLSLGSDTACSIRQPASVCGVVGFKPTYGRTSNEGVSVCAEILDHVGPITRTVRQSADLLGVIQNDGHGDPAALIGSDVSGLRVAVLTGEFLDHCETDVRAAFEPAVELIRSLGCEVGEVDLGLDLEATDDLANVFGVDLLTRYGDEIAAAGPAGVGSEVWEWFSLYGTIDPSTTAAAMDERDRIIEHVAGQTKEWDLLVCPSMRTATRTMAEGVAQPRIERMGNFSLWDVTGQPSLSVPFGTADNGMPLGLLITGQMGADDVVLQLGHAVEQSV